MAINLKESFRVSAPVEKVWQFLLDPHQVVVCMPGAELDKVVADGTFLGSIKVKVGPITATYKGRVQFTQVDENGYTIKMVAEGVETGGGNARGTMSSHLERLPDGMTEVQAEAVAEITGRIMQFGRGMIQGVSQQLFQQFAVAVGQRLEARAGAGVEGAALPEQKPINAIGLVFSYLWSAVVRFFRRLFGRKPKE